MFECVVNVSDGRRLDVLDELGLAAGPALRDRHSDPVHNRSVFTLIEHRTELRRYVRSFIVASMKLLDLRDHEGVHPCFGVLDVVPFVALDSRKADEAATLRNETASWVADTFDVPVFLYGRLRDGSKRSLPEVRRHAFKSLMPDMGPMKPERRARRQRHWGSARVGGLEPLGPGHHPRRGAHHRQGAAPT